MERAMTWVLAVSAAAGGLRAGGDGSGPEFRSNDTPASVATRWNEWLAESADPASWPALVAWLDTATALAEPITPLWTVEDVLTAEPYEAEWETGEQLALAWQPAADQLMEILSRPVVAPRLVPDLDAGLVPDLYAWSSLAQRLALLHAHQSAAGRTEEAVALTIALTDLARHLDRLPSEVRQYEVSMRLNQAMDALARTLERTRPNEDQLAGLRDAFAPWAERHSIWFEHLDADGLLVWWSLSYFAALPDNEQADLIDSIDGMLRRFPELAPRGWSPDEPPKHASPPTLDPIRLAGRQAAVTAALQADLDKPPHEIVLLSFERALRDLRTPADLPVLFRFLGLRQRFDSDIHDRVRLDATVVRIAAEQHRLRHGTYPVNLGAIDPDLAPAEAPDLYAGGRLTLRVSTRPHEYGEPVPEPEPFIYSKGHNGLNDGGRPHPRVYSHRTRWFTAAEWADLDNIARSAQPIDIVFFPWLPVEPAKEGNDALRRLFDPNWQPNAENEN